MTTEILSEPTQGTNIVVIHPGSYYLRIGRASDTYPAVLPHVIAHRHTNDNQARYEDPILLRPDLQTEVNHEKLMKNGLGVVEKAIWSRITYGQRRNPTLPEQVSIFNRNKPGQQLDDVPEKNWTNTENAPEFFIGEEALFISPQSNYSLHWPIRNGIFNIHQGVRGSVTAVVHDLEKIWGTVLEKKLDIHIKDLKFYRAVLLIPDIYHRPHVKELMNLLLVRLGFGAAITIQESICATFGCGLSSACVIDVGDQKSSVCCVEDGLSHRNTRVKMSYGGRDVSRSFAWLLSRIQFPYKEFELSNRMDALFIQDLKEQFCHLNHDVSGTKLLKFQVAHPGRRPILYQMKLGDEGLLAPYGLFSPLLFGLAGNQYVTTQQRNTGDPQDIHDENYLLQTQRQQQQPEANQKSGGKQKGQFLKVKREDMDEGEAMSTGDQKDVQVSTTQEELDDEKVPLTMSLRFTSNNQITPLPSVDNAILHSIDCCSSPETKKKMYSCVLVVGGGLLFPGALETLNYLLITKMPPLYKQSLENAEIVRKSKDLDPQVTCWKGGAILCFLDTCHELWIRQKEWKIYGVKILRERSPFVW